MNIKNIFILTLFTTTHALTITQPCHYHDATLPISLYHHQFAYFEYSNTVYIFGGTTTDREDVDTIYKWNISNEDSWFALIENKTPTPVFWSVVNSVITIENYAYFVGLRDADNGDYTGKIYIFDSLTESFRNTTNLSKPLYLPTYGCITTNRTHIIVVGGTSNIYLQIYDIYADKWVEEIIRVLPIHGLTGFYGQCCEMINDTLYVFGGVGYSSAGGTFLLDDYYKYELKTQTWTNFGKKSVVSAYGTALRYDSDILVIGGWNSTAVISNIDTFNQKNENFGNTYYILEPVLYFSALILSDQLYIFGGRNESEIGISRVQICAVSSESNLRRSDTYIFIIIFSILGVIILLAILTCIIRRFMRSAHRDRLESEISTISLFQQMTAK